MRYKNILSQLLRIAQLYASILTHFVIRHRNLLVLLFLITWLYTSVLMRLVLQWVGPHSDPNFQHGIFVPVFVLFVVW